MSSTTGSTSDSNLLDIPIPSRSLPDRPSGTLRLCSKCFEEIPPEVQTCPHCSDPIPEL